MQQNISSGVALQFCIPGGFLQLSYGNQAGCLGSARILVGKEFVPQPVAGSKICTVKTATGTSATSTATTRTPATPNHNHHHHNNNKHQIFTTATIKFHKRTTQQQGPWTETRNNPENNKESNGNRTRTKHKHHKHTGLMYHARIGFREPHWNSSSVQKPFIIPWFCCWFMPLLISAHFCSRKEVDFFLSKPSTSLSNSCWVKEFHSFTSLWPKQPSKPSADSLVGNRQHVRYSLSSCG